MAKEIAMTAIPLEFPRGKTLALRAVVRGLVRWRVTILLFAVGFPIAFYLSLLGLLVVEYGHFPNYIIRYDWAANVLRIIRSTPSVIDMFPIILNEWLLEIGYMNYDYGRGVAEWSLSIIPHKLAIMSLAGALIGLNITLLVERQVARSLPQQCVLACRSGFLTSFGALCTGLTSATVFSVACCAVPSWVGSLAILGVGTSVAFALEPFGAFASALGLMVLIVSALWIAHNTRSAQSSTVLASPKQAL
jgi:hypothetical protein